MFKPTGLLWLNSTDFDSAWATDAAYKDGRYYWYLSAGKGRIAVVSSENPDGPFTDAKGEPFYTPTPDVLLNSTGVVPPATGARDPSVLLDDDGSHYLVAAFDGANGVPGLGNCGYFTVQLTEDMTKNASAWTHMDVHDPDGSFGPGYEDDKPFLHVSTTRPPLRCDLSPDTCWITIAEARRGVLPQLGLFLQHRYLTPRPVSVPWQRA